MTKKKQRTTLFPLFLLFITALIIFSTVTPQGSLSQDPPVTIMALETENQDIEPDTDFSVTITVQPGQDIAGVQCDLHYDPSLITVINVIEGNLFTGYDTHFNPGKNDPLNGTLTGIAGVITTPGGQIKQTGVFATLHLKTLMKPGFSSLALSNVIIGGVTAESLPVTVENTSIAITGGAEITTVYINTPTQTLLPDETSTFTIVVSPTTEIAGVQAALDFDPSFIQILNITKGTLFGSTAYFHTPTIDNVNGTIDSISSVTTSPGGTLIPGTLVHITFKSLQKGGNTIIGLKHVLTGDPEGNQVSCITQDGTITISTADSTQVIITPSHQAIPQGATATVAIQINPQEYIAGVQFDLTFDPSLLTAQSVAQGNFFLGRDSYFHTGTIDNTQGVIHGVAGTVLGASSGTINPGILATVTFTATSPTGQSPIGLTNVLLGDSDAQPCLFTLSNGSIEVLPNYTSISIIPETKFVAPGDTFTLDIRVDPLEPISGVETDITFNPNFLTAVAVDEGDLFAGFNTYFNNGTLNNTHGTIKGIWGVIADVGGGDTTSPGNFAQVTFMAGNTYGSTPINLSHVLIGTPGAIPVQINIHHGTVAIGVSLTFSLKAGWNILSIPFQEMFTAETLGKIIGVSDAIAKWNPASQDYMIHLVGLSGQDFIIEPGHGYLIHVYEDTQFSTAGVLIDSLTVPIKMGWNLVGWTHDTDTTAEQFGATIAGCDVVAKWNPETQDYTIHPQTTPLDNFTIHQGDALFIHTNQDSTWYGG